MISTKTKYYYLSIIIVVFTLSCFKDATCDLAITNVNIIDVSRGATLENRTILIKGNKISKIIPSKKFKSGKEINRIDGSGKYIIPGLWDMHSHFASADYLGLYFSNGVLGIRIMWGTPSHHYLREKIRNGKLLGPRMVIASPLIDGDNPIWPGSAMASNVSMAQEIVHESKANGADFVKVYSLLSRDVYFAIIEESRKLNIPVSGHVPIEVSAFEVSNAGQKCIEHLDGVILACLNTEDSIRQKAITKFDRYLPKDSSRNVWKNFQKSIVESLNDNYNKNKTDSLFQLFIKNDTWHCPTLVVLKVFAYLDDDSIANDIRSHYLSRRIRSNWKNRRDQYCNIMNEEDWLNKKKLFHHVLTFVNRMHKKGVKFIAGTDTANPYCFPGFSLHDELDLLVQAGLSPLEALKTATINPAIFNESIDSLGTIEKDKIADLVLLEANPLDDIKNTKNIYAVVRNGNLFVKNELEKMLNDIEILTK